MRTYLSKRGATYYFRRAVPEELRTALGGRHEWMISLRTKDHAEAKRRIPAHAKETDRLIDEARRTITSRGAQDGCTAPSQTMTDAEYARFMHDMEGAEIIYRELVEKEERYEERAALRDRLRRAFKKSTAQITPEEAAMRDLLREAVELTEQQTREAERAVVKAETRRGWGPPSGRTPPNRPASLPLLDLFDAYAAEQGLKAVTASEWRGNLRTLITHAGHDDAARLTVDEVDAWRDALLTGTTKRGSLRSPRTVKDKYISALRATLNYAVSKRKLVDNVASKVSVRVPHKAKLREKDFTNAEVEAILAATLRPQTDVSNFQQRARRWVPWLCAYTGARVNEMSQLRGSDVAEVDGVWTVRITPEAGTVKSGHARTVPLHPHLIEQGFPAFAIAAEGAPLFYDPGRVRKPGPGNRHVKKVGELLAAWVRQSAGITDPNVQPNHGWRHLFKTRAVEADIPERVADAIQGHAPKSVGQAYGRVSLKAMSEAMARLPRFATDKHPVAPATVA